MNSNILNSVNSHLLDQKLLSVSERYYDHKLCNKIDGINAVIFQRVSFHSNKICLISLSTEHPVISENRNIVKINFEIDDKYNRVQNNATGKGKRGAQKLTPHSVICIIETDDGQKYPVYSCMSGKLIEVNTQLIENPNLLKQKPTSDGYIALLLPFLKEFNAYKDSLIEDKL